MELCDKKQLISIILSENKQMDGDGGAINIYPFNSFSKETLNRGKIVTFSLESNEFWSVSYEDGSTDLFRYYNTKVDVHGIKVIALRELYADISTFERVYEQLKG